MKKNVKAVPENLKRSVIYQLFLRAFTVEGTLEAAEKKLPDIKALGFDIVYLCPICTEDDDMDKAYWSPRQKETGFGNPKNPYRIKDYFNIDEEYGTDEDFKHFVNAAHSLGLKIMFDLVYMHCGPKAVFLAEHPNFVQRYENGEILYGKDFALSLINFEDQKLCEYLWDNMVYWVKEFDVDCYRCDVGDAVPLDFWQEGFKRVKDIKSDFIMLNEGVKGDYLVGENSFNINYCVQWCATLSWVLRKQHDKTAKDLRICEKGSQMFPAGGRGISTLDNHDTANESYNSRIDSAVGSDGMEAALALNYLIDGVPFIYNGNEICDTNRHSIFSNRFFSQFIIDWAKKDTDDAKNRMAFIKKMNKLRQENAFLFDGETTWVDNDCPDTILTFTRTLGDKKWFVLVNLSSDKQNVNTKFDKPLNNKILCKNVYKTENEFIAEPYGYIVYDF